MATGTTFLVRVLLKAESNVDSVMGKAAASSRKAALEAEKAQGSFGKWGGVLKGAGAAFEAFGLVAAASMAIGVKGAADLQDAIAQIGVAMGKSSDWVDRNFTDVAMQMSNATAQSVSQSMALLRVMATSGINDPKDMRALAMPIAKFADTQYLGKNHTPFEESVSLASQVAHEFGARSADQMSPILNTLFKISQDMPDSLKTAGTQLKYYAPQYTAAGVSATDILQLQATADRMGLGGGRSGTGFRAVLDSLISPTAPQARAQGNLGLLGGDGKDKFIDQRTGKFRVNDFFDYLNSKYDDARKNGTVGAFNQNLRGISTSGASSILALLSSDAGKGQRENVRKTLLRVPDLEVAQAQLLDTLNNQTKRLITNFETLTTMLAKPFIKDFTHAVSAVADALGNMGDWLHKHPGPAKLIGGGLAIAGGIATIVAIERVMGVLSRMGGESKALRLFEPFFKMVGGAIGPAFKFIAERAIPWLIDILPAAFLRFGSKMIPFVGWFLLAVDIITNAPSWSVAFMSWWGKNEASIGYAIGYGVSWVGKTMQTAISALFSALGSSLKAALDNLLFLATGDMSEWQNKVQDAYEKSLRESGGEHFGGAFGRGMKDASEGKAFEIHVHNDVKSTDPNTTVHTTIARGRNAGQGRGNAPTPTARAPRVQTGGGWGVGI